jgi:Raf kinase inhibitor-like YbhB/YbcL family protein
VIAALLAAAALSLSSPAFAQRGAIPKRFTCDGAGISPPLRWTAPPRGTRSFALEVVDLDTPLRFKHWLAWGISPRSRGLAAGARPPRQGRNDFGRVGWGGPCPPSGAKHRYDFLLFALRRPLSLRNGATWQQFRRALRGDVLRSASLEGTYRRR